MKTPEAPREGKKRREADAAWRKKKQKKRKILDRFTWGGFFLVCMMAWGFAYDWFGETGGFISFLPIVFVAGRVMNWYNELEVFRLIAEKNYD